MKINRSINMFFPLSIVKAQKHWAKDIFLKAIIPKNIVLKEECKDQKTHWAPKKGKKKCSCSVPICKAQTRHQRCYTRVRRGDVRGTPLPTCPAASCHVAFVFFKPTRTDLCRHSFDSGRFVLNRANLGRIG